MFKSFVVISGKTWQGKVNVSVGKNLISDWVWYFSTFYTRNFHLNEMLCGYLICNRQKWICLGWKFGEVSGGRGGTGYVWDSHTPPRPCPVSVTWVQLTLQSPSCHRGRHCPERETYSRLESVSRWAPGAGWISLVSYPTPWLFYNTSERWGWLFFSPGFCLLWWSSAYSWK